MNDLFVCDKCGTVDALSLVLTASAPPGGILLCTACLPTTQTYPWLKVGTGQWHNLFERKTYKPNEAFVLNRPTGFSLD